MFGRFSRATAEVFSLFHKSVMNSDRVGARSVMCIEIKSRILQMVAECGGQQRGFAEV